jgi:hypothetical protein
MKLEARDYLMKLPLGMARISERIVIPQETHILNGLNLQDCAQLI